MSDFTPAPARVNRAEYKQKCPGCEKILSIVARFCSRCGDQLRTDD